MALRAVLATSVLLLRASAIPTQVSPEEAALVTSAPTRTLAVYASYARARRNVLSDLASDVDGYVNSIFSELGSAIPSYVSNGLLPGLQGLPTGSAVATSVGASSSDLAASPTQVLNMPGYGNWTTSGWNLRIHGNVFKQPNISNATVDKLANGFLIGTSIAQLPPSQQDQARNLTREIYVVQQGNQTVSVNILPGPQAGSNGQSGGGGGVTPAGGEQFLTLPNPTTPEGDFDVFVPINGSLQLTPGTGESPPQRLNVYTQGTDTGNATSYLVSDQGLTVILRHRRHPPRDKDLRTKGRPPQLLRPSIHALDEHAGHLPQLVRQPA